MVGRATELNLLLTAASRAESGHAQVVVVTGEPGIGKTRLVQEFTAVLPEETVIAFGHAVPLSQGTVPYGLAADLLRWLVRRVGGKPVQDALAKRARFLAPLVPQLGNGTEDPVDRLALFAATQDLLVELAAETLVVLVVEDLHWGDPASTDLVHFWARTITQGRLLLVVTSRDVDEDGTIVHQIRELPRLPHGVEIALAPLNAEAVQAQLEQLQAAASRDQVAAVVRLSEGVPLFVEELVAAGFDEHSALRIDLTSRLPELGDEGIAVVQVASLASGTMDSETLCEVAGIARGVVSRVFAVAEKHGLMERRGPREWSFTHELLRIAVTHTATDEQLVGGHEAWARVLGQRPSREDLVASADHWAATGNHRSAFEARVRAAQAVWDASGTEDVGRQWLAALRLIHVNPGLVSRKEHGDVIACVALTNRWWETTVELLRAETAAPGHRDLPQADLIVLLGFLASIFADEMESVPPTSVPPTRDELLDITTRWQSREPSRLGYVTTSNLCRSQIRLGHLHDVPTTLALMSQQAGGIPDYQTRATAFVHVLAGGPLSTASPDERRAHASQGLAIAPNLDTLSQAQVVLFAGETLVVLGDLNAGWAAVREAYRLVPSPEASYFWVPISNSVAYVGFLVGEWETVLTVASYADAAPMGPANYIKLVLHGWLVLALRGAFEAHDADGPDDADDADDPTTSMRLVAAALSQRHSNPAAARLLIAKAMSAPTHVSVFGHLEFGTAGYVWSLAAELAWRDPGTPRSYMTAVELGSSELTQPRPPGQVPPGRAEELWRSQAAAHLARATGNATAAAWGTLATQWDQIGARHQAAEARLRLAEDLSAEGDREGAAAALSSALSVAESLKALPLSDEIRGFAARARLKLPGHTRPANTLGPLTAREHEVLQLLVQGLTNQQIGDTLFISPKTASVHVSHILDKLNASNRTEVASIAHRRGLLEHD